MTILITGATGMFGNAVLQALIKKNPTLKIKAATRNVDATKSSKLGHIPGVEWVYVDFFKTETLDQALADVERAFLVTPMSNVIDVMEINFINAALRSKVKKVYKLYGAVDHHGNDPLGNMHNRSAEYLKASGLPWTLISPNSVMETCFLNPMSAATIKHENALYCCSAHHKIGLVALEDIANASAHLLTTAHDDFQNYQLTGPDALSYYDVAAIFSGALGKKIEYHDYSIEDFKQILVEATEVLAMKKLRFRSYVITEHGEMMVQL